MKRTRLFAALLLLLPAAATAADLTVGEQDTVSITATKVQPSVMEIADKQGKTAELQRLADSLETQFISALGATRVFRLQESRKTEATEGETTAAAGTDKESVPATGQTAAARFAFQPQIDGFEDSTEQVRYTATGRTKSSRKIFISAIVQVVETATGKMLAEAPSVQLTREAATVSTKGSREPGGDREIVALAREAAQKLAQDVVALLRPAKVLSVTGRQLLINRGTEAGFASGDLLDVFAVRQVKDDDSGEIFFEEIPVGQAIITRLDKKQSYANISGDDLGIAKGAVVRKLKSAAARREEWLSQPPDPTLPDFGTPEATEANPASGEKPLKWK
jgi:hypothetical protein